MFTRIRLLLALTLFTTAGSGFAADVLSNNDVKKVLISPDGKTVYVAERDQRIVAFDAATKKMTHSGKLSNDSAQMTALTPDGKIVTTGMEKDTYFIRVRDPKTFKELDLFDNLPGRIGGVVFTRDGKLMAVSSATGGGKPPQIFVRDLSTKKVISTFAAYGQPIAFSPNGKFILARDVKDVRGSKINVVNVHNLKGGVLFSVPAGKFQGGVPSFAFSPDGKYVVLSESKAVHVWNAANLKPVRALEHPSTVVAVDFTPDGKLFTACLDLRLRLFDLKTGKAEVLEPKLTNRGIRDIVPAPNGGFVVWVEQGDAKLVRLR